MVRLAIIAEARHKAGKWAERAKDLTGIASTLIDKRQLLKGEPTAITKFEDIRKLDEDAKALHDEMIRRGLVPGPVIDVAPEKNGEKG